MFSTGAINSENLVVSDGQPLKIVKAGASLFYSIHHLTRELGCGVSAFRSTDPYDDSFVIMDILSNIGARQINISAVQSPNSSHSLRVFNSADEFQRS